MIIIGLQDVIFFSRLMKYKVYLLIDPDDNNAHELLI